MQINTSHSRPILYSGILNLWNLHACIRPNAFRVLLISLYSIEMCPHCRCLVTPDSVIMTVTTNLSSTSLRNFEWFRCLHYFSELLHYSSVCRIKPIRSTETFSNTWLSLLAQKDKLFWQQQSRLIPALTWRVRSCWTPCAHQVT